MTTASILYGDLQTLHTPCAVNIYHQALGAGYQLQYAYFVHHIHHILICYLLQTQSRKGFLAGYDFGVADLTVADFGVVDLNCVGLVERMVRKQLVSMA